MRKLKRIADTVGDLIENADLANNPGNQQRVNDQIAAYQDLLEGWASDTALRMVEHSNQQNIKYWRSLSAQMSRGMRELIESPAMSGTMDALIQRQKDLITSIPEYAIERTNKIVTEGKIAGKRAEQLADELQETTSVTRSKAVLIARTETQRTNAELTNARAEGVGATHYIWRTAGDADVRHGHKEMANKVFAYANPPAVNEGTAEKPKYYVHGPGEIWNCFSGDTPVSVTNGVSDIFRTLHEGTILDVHVGSRSFGVTPNHPAMSRSGWKPIGEFERGEDILCFGGDDVFTTEHHINKTSPRFDDLFFAFRGSINGAAPVEFNFHGQIPEGDVDHVSIGHHLTSNGPSSSLKRACDFVFSLPDPLRRVVATLGILGQIAEAFRSGISDQSISLFLGGIAHSDMHGIAAGSDAQVMLTQHPSDNTPGYTKALAELQHTSAAEIHRYDVALRKVINSVCSRGSFLNSDAPSADMLAQNVRVMPEMFGDAFESRSLGYHFARISDVFVRNFSGHVYTLSSDFGWYSVTRAGIISKNCRCFAEPILPD